jgi:hypothetical protein
MFSNSQLPCSLKYLQCGRLEGIRPLLPLRYLQRLDIQSSRSTAAELACLSALTGLTQISLGYMDIESYNADYYVGVNELDIAPSASSEAWPALANKLRQLHIYELCDFGMSDVEYERLDASAVEAIGSLTALTSLQLVGLECLDTPPALLAAALRRCTALQRLTLGHLDLQWLVDGAANNVGALLTDEQRLAQAKTAGMETVAAAIASLPSLQSLRLRKLPLSVQATAKLAAAAAGTQLTRLQLEDCGVTGAGLSAIALGLCNLKDLDVRVDGGVDAVFPVLARLPLQRLQLGPGWTMNAESLAVFLPCWRGLLPASPYW